MYLTWFILSIIMKRTTMNSTRQVRPKRDKDLRDLEAVVAYLNLSEVPIPVFGPGFTFQKLRTWNFTPFKQALRKLVKEWQDSGPNMELLIERNPSLWEKIKRVTIELKSTSTGGVRVEPGAIPQEKSLPRFDLLVHAFFLLLIMNPYWNRLGGPCARCDNYYVKKTNRQKVYCSKHCGLMETSINANRKRRSRLHIEKVEKARIVIAKWETTRTKRNWKTWVSEKTGFTINWLTRAVARGDLHEPTGSNIKIRSTHERRSSNHAPDR
jgi:hypothetical protein